LRYDEKTLKSFYGSEYVKKYHKEDLSRIKRLFKHISLSNTDVVLDAGCGNGLLLNYVYKKVKKYIGIDFSKEFIEESIKNKPLDAKNSEFICGDINYYCLENEQEFSKVFILDFVEHVYTEDLIKILKSINKSMKKGAKLFIHTPNALFFNEILKDIGILKQIKEHIAVRNAKSLVKILKTAGFKNINVRYLKHYNILGRLHIFRKLPFVGKYFRARLFIECEK